jgi:hypothetical protein
MDDLVNYILAGSKGGTATTDQGIDARFSNPNSRFANAGANEFDAVVAKAYASQFKAYALGLNVVFNPGDNPQVAANNILIGQSTPMTPEAELIAQVAATYRGDFGHAATYNNPALKQLLVSWGRTDIANQALVGVADVQSIGGVVKALNEQPDPAIRQKWIQQIFDFQNNSPSSPSGAVPDLPDYQVAVAMVKNGNINQLLNNYLTGVKTSGPVNISLQVQPSTVSTTPAPAASNNTFTFPGFPPGFLIGGNVNMAPSPAPFSFGVPQSPIQPAQPAQPTPVAKQPVPVGTQPATQANTLATPDINQGVDFHQLPTDQRAQFGLSDRDRAILHLWGRQVISKGFEDGGIYFNVLQTEPTRFQPAETALIQELAGKEQAEFGGINGKELDKAFFDLMQRMHPGEAIDTSKWLNAPARFATGPVNIVSDLGALQQQTGLSTFDQAVMRLWGHEPLLNGGRSDGSILAYTIGNPNSLDSMANAANGGQNVNIDSIAQALLQDDFTSDGVRNGDSLRFAFGQVLNHIYLGAPDPTQQTVDVNAQQKAAQNGRTPAQIGRDVQQGVVQAMADAANMIKDHPLISAASVGGIAAASAICPFLGGLAVGGAGIAAGQSIINSMSKPQAPAAGTAA